MDSPVAAGVALVVASFSSGRGHSEFRETKAIVLTFASLENPFLNTPAPKRTVGRAILRSTYGADLSLAATAKCPTNKQMCNEGRGAFTRLRFWPLISPALYTTARR